MGSEGFLTIRRFLCVCYLIFVKTGFKIASESLQKRLKRVPRRPIASSIGHNGTWGHHGVKIRFKKDSKTRPCGFRVISCGCRNLQSLPNFPSGPQNGNPNRPKHTPNGPQMEHERTPDRSASKSTSESYLSTIIHQQSSIANYPSAIIHHPARTINVVSSVIHQRLPSIYPKPPITHHEAL